MPAGELEMVPDPSPNFMITKLKLLGKGADRLSESYSYAPISTMLPGATIIPESSVTLIELVKSKIRGFPCHAALFPLSMAGEPTRSLKSEPNRCDPPALTNRGSPIELFLSFVVIPNPANIVFHPANENV
jgi:hypothetical protein